LVSSTAMGSNLLTLTRDGSGLPGSSGFPSMLVPLYGDDDVSLSNDTIHKRYPVKKTRESVDDSLQDDCVCSYFMARMQSFVPKSNHCKGPPANFNGILLIWSY
jgi:hypothetical protein